MKLFASLSFLLVLSLGCALGEDSPKDEDILDETGVIDDDDDDDTDDEDTDDEDPGPTTGPGVLGDESGLEAMCRRYVECGGGYYADEEDCIEASYDYWGDCPQVAAALDALGECMAYVDCDDYNPDNYRPSSVGCGEEWDDLTQAECR